LCVGVVTSLTLSGQSTAIIGVTSGPGNSMDELSRRGVFDAPAGARLDLFQFAGFPDGQPFGDPIHIVVPTDTRR
jgi:hypothetical protein